MEGVRGAGGRGGRRGVSSCGRGDTGGASHVWLDKAKDGSSQLYFYWRFGLFNSCLSRLVLTKEQGVENVYTQHQPLIFQTMEGIVKGRLRDADYPLVGNHFQQGRPQDVVIFIVGGTTYEEARSVALYNAANPGVRFFLGGSVVLNSKSGIFGLQFLQLVSIKLDLDERDHGLMMLPMTLQIS
ncbi:Vacuolar protein sorting-associated protein 45-like protein [Triticum urartu]|uniref:Vacuolar protein sorting-associated protein 45-like protein n=1 Tax=Triticum urartu TaxID=4572 RepID=M7ZWL5_TRIUA|nr:Vacuolar protein sorting-associated protein 45-like protein [Triticum urartu]